MKGPVIETARLMLRPPAMADFEAWAGMMAEPETARFIGGVQPRSMAWRGIMTMAGSWALMGFGMFSVVERATGRWIGRVGPWRPEGWPGPEVGWAIAREAQGKGYAFEAAEAATGWAFDVLGWAEVTHVIHPANARSQALARKLGSRLRGPARMPAPFAGEEVELWGQDAAAWRRSPHRAGAARA